MDIKSTLLSKAIEGRWLPKELNAIAHKSLRKRGENIDFPFETDFFGIKYFGNLTNNVEYNIYRYGAFEKYLLFFLRDTLQNLSSSESKQAVFYDIGANIGQHSLYMSQYAQEVHSFEPYEPVYSRLEQHIKVNSIDNIFLHTVGLSNEDNTLNFFAPSGHNQGIGSFDESTLEKGNVCAGKLQIVEGDSFIQKLGLPSCDILKVDVEGLEKNVLLGLQTTLRKSRPIIICEVSYGKPLSFQSLDDFTSTLPEDYSLFSFNNRKADGSKAKKRGRKARYSGEYKVVPFNSIWKFSGQDDIIACPKEKLHALSTQRA